MINLTPQQLRKAANIQEKIQSLQKQLGQLLGGEVSTAAEPTEAPKKRKFSAAARAKMKAAQKARWAKIKGESKPFQSQRKLKRQEEEEDDTCLESGFGSCVGGEASES